MMPLTLTDQTTSTDGLPNNDFTTITNPNPTITVKSTIAFRMPALLKELYYFMGVVNYFKDHWRDHSVEAKPLYDMVALTTSQKTKSLPWTP